MNAEWIKEFNAITTLEELLNFKIKLFRFCQQAGVFVTQKEIENRETYQFFEKLIEKKMDTLLQKGKVEPSNTSATDDVPEKIHSDYVARSLGNVTSVSDLSVNILLKLTEKEARALKALTLYGSEAFLKYFYEFLGKTYLEPHSQGIVSLFDTIKTQLPRHLEKADAARKIWNQ